MEVIKINKLKLYIVHYTESKLKEKEVFVAFSDKDILKAFEQKKVLNRDGLLISKIELITNEPLIYGKMILINNDATKVKELHFKELITFDDMIKKCEVEL
jgi:hypothetical protein